jgi:hypothetical protein
LKHIGGRRVRRAGPPASFVGKFFVLDSIRVREYHFFVMRDIDSELNGRENASPKKRKVLSLMTLSVETYKEQYRYFKTLRDGLRKMQRQGATLADAKERYTIDRDFPYFKDKRLEIRGTNIHENNIEAIWGRLAEIRY